MTKPFFRADQVGSLLRPAELLAARAAPEMLMWWRARPGCRARKASAVMPPIELPITQATRSTPIGYAVSPKPTAAMLENLRRQPTTAALHFAVRHGVHLHHVDGVRFRQSTSVRSSDRRVRSDGIVIASWPRLAFDLALEHGQTLL